MSDPNDAIAFRPLNDVRCELGESPTFDPRRNALWFCDIAGHALHSVDIATNAHRQWSFASEVASLGICESGRILVALRDTVGTFDPADGTFAGIARIEADRPETRLNDGKVGPDGAFWVGTMDDRDQPVKEPIGSLYRVTADGTVERKVDKLMVPNGLAFTPGGDAMFHSDSRGPWIDRWDFNPATGEISNRRRIATLDNATGRPDGGATDADGGYWSAGISAARLNRFSPTGELIAHYAVPVAAPTMPCFAGPDMKTLYVTSLRTGRTAEALARYPLTGITIVGRSPVAGAPVSRFRDR